MPRMWLSGRDGFHHVALYGAEPVAGIASRCPAHLDDQITFEDFPDFNDALMALEELEEVVRVTVGTEVKEFAGTACRACMDEVIELAMAECGLFAAVAAQR